MSRKAALPPAAPPPIVFLTNTRLQHRTLHGALTPLLLGKADTDASGQSGHHLMWSLFDVGRHLNRDFLWARIGTGEYTLLSARHPRDTHKLFELLEPHVFWPRLLTGTRYRFRLHASPRIARRTDGVPSPKIDVVTDAIQRKKRDHKEATQAEGMRWLRRIANGAGFVPSETCRAFNHRIHRIQRPDGSRMVYGTVDFQGTLQVTDSNKLRGRIHAGFGAGKAYGCGLLRLRTI